MIKIDEDNFINIKREDKFLKIILNLKIGFKKSYIVEFKLNSDQVNDLITKLVSENSKIRL
jgi:hypothetical protein